ncbi:MAG: NAD(P)/FAD-dependent oxidoreductase [Polyangiaceae bacterium]|nr:NAD(P)/FAD-dependent oxidoreductase [Polyangiaceae bacterium]
MTSVKQSFGRQPRYDVVVVGSGPNGLSAALLFARQGLSTLVIEAKDTPGGGARSAALTLPGYLHDTCSTVHPLGVASPFFRTLDLEKHGVSWCDPPLALAHVLPDGTAVTLERSVASTARGLGADDQAYLDLMTPFVEQGPALLHAILGPLRIPRDPLLLARFGLLALESLTGFAKRHLQTERARALLAGMGAHAMQPLENSATASFGMVLALAGHLAGWPVARGGSQEITNALVRLLESSGGELALGRAVEAYDELPAAKAYVFDITPRQLLHVAGPLLPVGYRERLRRFRYGPGVFKMDWALAGPVPWRDPTCALAATVHLAGELSDVASSEAHVERGQISPQPFVIFVQPSLFDPTRAPAGHHTAWAYCHVPPGSTVDVSSLIEEQVERFAPGFRKLVLARSHMNAEAMERYNPNYVGGDINGGAALLSQLFTRPVARLDPYSTPNPKIFMCSSSTPPGGGVHGMCGYWAARSVLRNVFGRAAPDLT